MQLPSVDQELSSRRGTSKSNGARTRAARPGGHYRSRRDDTLSRSADTARGDAGVAATGRSPMSASKLHDLSRCAIHTMTNRPWTLRECVDAYAKAGVGGISVWRNVIEPIGAAEAGRILRGAGLHVPALV